MKVLVIGATGSIGRHVVSQAIAAGHDTRALVRDQRRGESMLPAAAELVVGDGNDPAAIEQVVDGIDAIVFTHGSHGATGAAEEIDYGLVHSALTALKGRTVRISLMTSIGVTVHDGPHNRSTQAHDWKRRSERLVRVSGNPYTIVRPGWFDYNAPDERHIVFLQGDTRRAGNSSDGVIARDEIARVLVDALTIPEAAGKTLELVAEQGEEQADLTPDFAQLTPDHPGAYDAALDPDTLPLKREPSTVREQLESIKEN
ncbi:SDR family oxidoreductase [Corynebacterium lubricantis]|uniref:SDR family oxidoreductase n=1 Tax=Corynebacterium lubricantis TaxID=541095 RepID=UPI00036220F7|nr:SDR family oxidoreductase [Corynebacterium lubricantis]